MFLLLLVLVEIEKEHLRGFGGGDYQGNGLIHDSRVAGFEGFSVQRHPALRDVDPLMIMGKACHAARQLVKDHVSCLSITYGHT